MFLKTITSDRIILRPYESGDISSWQRWDVDPEVQAFLPGPKNIPVSDEVQQKYLEECENDREGYYWSIVWKENNLLIGTISITEINKNQSTGELGIVIGEKEYWGRGIAEEAIKNIFKIVKDLGIQRINAEFEEVNIGMQKALLRAGFKKEATLVASRMKDGHSINIEKYFIELK